MRCAVNKCSQSNNKKKSIDERSVAFYVFPKDEAQTKLWVKFCNRPNGVNVQRERICALHFKKEDFERNLRFEMGFSNRSTPRLKRGAVPTVEPIAIENKIETVTCEENNIPSAADIQEDCLQRCDTILERKIKTLRQENNMLKMTQNRSATKIRKLSSQIQKLTVTNENLEKALRRLFTESQIKILKSGDKRQNFRKADIDQSLVLYSTSVKAYNLLKEKNFPLPSVRTLQRWLKKRKGNDKNESENPQLDNLSEYICNKL